MPSHAGQHVVDRDVATELGVSEVTPASAMPHGTKRSYQPRSTSQLRAKPCIVTPRLTRIPIAAILRSGPRSSAPQPHAAAAGDAGGGDAEVGADRDQRLLDAAYVVDDLDVVGQPNDRVADQLAGAVEGDLAAAVDVDDRRAAGVQRPLVGSVRLPAVNTGGCSSSSTVSARAPATTSACTSRCRSQAAR